MPKKNYFQQTKKRTKNILEIHINNTFRTFTNFCILLKLNISNSKITPLKIIYYYLPVGGSVYPVDVS